MKKHYQPLQFQGNCEYSMIAQIFKFSFAVSDWRDLYVKVNNNMLAIRRPVKVINTIFVTVTNTNWLEHNFTILILFVIEKYLWHIESKIL